eukprot:5434615-Pleurochrysis_carterae.AAC.1
MDTHCSTLCIWDTNASTRISSRALTSRTSRRTRVRAQPGTRDCNAHAHALPTSSTRVCLRRSCMPSSCECADDRCFQPRLWQPSNALATFSCYEWLNSDEAPMWPRAHAHGVRLHAAEPHCAPPPPVRRQSPSDLRAI